MTGGLQASPVFDPQKRAYLADMAGSVQTLDPEGKPVWQRRVDGAVSSTPALQPEGSRLFVGTHLGVVWGLDTARGAVVWQKALPTRADPRILADLLFVPGRNWVVTSSWGGRFVALDAATGAEKANWDAGLSPASAASATPEGRVFCLRAVAKRGVECVEVGPGGEDTVLHTLPEPSRGANRTVVIAAPVVDVVRQRLLWIANGDREASLIAWDLPRGALIWTCPLQACVQGTPALLPNGTAVVPDYRGNVVGVDMQGQPRFTYATGGDYLLAGAVADGNNTLWIGDPLGQVHHVDADGRGRATTLAPRAIQGRPAFSPEGELWVPTMDRAVYVLGGTV